MGSDGSCCSCSIGSGRGLGPGRGLRLLEYRRQEAGSRGDSDGSCCSCLIERGLRLLEYRPRQEAGSELDLDLDLDHDGRRHQPPQPPPPQPPSLATPTSNPPQQVLYLRNQEWVKVIAGAQPLWSSITATRCLSIRGRIRIDCYARQLRQVSPIGLTKKLMLKPRGSRLLPTLGGGGRPIEP